MKTASEKLLIIAGKMPVARTEKMNISGIWQSINSMVKTATTLLAAILRTRVLLPAKKALLPQKKQLLPARNKI